MITKDTKYLVQDIFYCYILVIGAKGILLVLYIGGGGGEKSLKDQVLI